MAVRKTTIGGARAGSGRKPVLEQLKKVPYNTKLPQWLKDWLTTRKDREESGPVLIERALCRVYKLQPPDEDKKCG